MKEAPPRAENHENAKHFWNKKKLHLNIRKKTLLL